LTDLPCGGKPKCDGVVGNLIGAPIVRNIGYLDSSLRGGVHINYVHASSVAGDDAAFCKCIDGSRANRGVLSKDSISVASAVDNFIFSFALRGDELKPSAFDDPALDVYVAKVVVRDQYRLLCVCSFV
jgi:hypothetical protein